MTNPDIHDAKTAIDELSSDPKARQLAEDRALWQYVQRRERDHQFREGKAEGIREGMREGKAEGMREGRVRGAIESACRLLAIELTPERQQRLEHAPLEELTALLQRLEAERAWPE